jgi:hypothetical protein
MGSGKPFRTILIGLLFDNKTLDLPVHSLDILGKDFRKRKI